MITIGCKEHPNYAAIRAPRSTKKEPLGCQACWFLYNLKKYGKLYENGVAQFVVE